jgi:DNA-binding transcriptional LysR family regulator
MRLGHFDLNLFIALDALLETKSVTKASERLHLGASATSSALGRLREMFGDELLVQVGRRLELTPLAESLREPVRDILLRSQAALSIKTGFDPASEERCFTFNASDYMTTVLLGLVARRLEAAAPGISIDVLGLGDNPRERLERGDVDFAIYPEKERSPDHPSAPLFEDSYTCIVWTENKLVGDTISFDDFMKLSHVTTQTGNNRQVSFEGWFFATFGYVRKVAVSVSTFNGLPPLVVGTNRIATVQTRLAREYATHLPLRLLAPPLDIPPLRMVLQWNQHRTDDPAHAWLRALLQEIARDDVSACR